MSVKLQNDVFAAWRLWQVKAPLVRLPANQCKGLFSF